MKMKTLCLILCVFAGAGASLSAQTLLIDFNSAAGSLSTSDSQVTVTNVAGGSVQYGEDTISLVMDGFQSSSSTLNGGATTSIVPSAAANDYFFVRAADPGTTAPGRTATITISGLTGTYYSIMMTASVKSGGESVNVTRLGDYSINGDYGTNGDDFNAYSDGYQSGETIVWSSVEAVDGTITITIVAPAGDANPSEEGIQDYVTMLNSLTITAIPEPATMSALLGMSVIGLLFMRKRRR